MSEFYKLLEMQEETKGDPDLKRLLESECRMKEKDHAEMVQRFENPDRKPKRGKDEPEIKLTEELKRLYLMKPPENDQNLLNHFIVINLPDLNDAEKIKKFRILIDKRINDLVAAHGPNLKPLGVDIFNGAAYFRYPTIKDARKVMEILNNTKNMGVPLKVPVKTFTIKEFQSIVGRQMMHHNVWLASDKEKASYTLDPAVRDQFVYSEGAEVNLHWMDYLDKASTLAHIIRTQDEEPVLKVGFSTRGSYMTVCRKSGVYLYVGDAMRLYGVYEHKKSNNFKFSPDERYLVTFSQAFAKQELTLSNFNGYILWGVDERTILARFPLDAGKGVECFQFTRDSSKLAIALNGYIGVYLSSNVKDLKTALNSDFQKKEKEHLHKFENVAKIAWLPDNKNLVYLCYKFNFTPQSAAATKMGIYNTVDRTERKWRAWGDHAKNGVITIPDNGQWVAVTIKKYVKKNIFSTVVQVANLMTKAAELQISTIDIKDNVMNISWDTKHNRFGYLCEDETTKKGVHVRYIANFYQVEVKEDKRNLELKEICTTDNLLTNRITLTENGTFVAFYNVSADSSERGRFSFAYLNCVVTKDKPKRYSIDFIKKDLLVNQMSFFKLDTSGRFVLLGTEKTYQVWSTIGELVCKDTLQKQTVAQWRPRFLKQLPKELEDNLAARMNEIIKKYNEEDNLRTDSLKFEKEEAKKKRRVEFTEYITKKRQWYTQFVDLRAKLLGFDENAAHTATFEHIEYVIRINK